MSEYFKFNIEDVNEESDTESVTSDIEEDYTLDDWDSGTNRFNEFENIYYTLRQTVSTNIYSNSSFY